MYTVDYKVPVQYVSRHLIHQLTYTCTRAPYGPHASHTKWVINSTQYLYFSFLQCAVKYVNAPTVWLRYREIKSTTYVPLWLWTTEGNKICHQWKIWDTAYIYIFFCTVIHAQICITWHFAASTDWGEWRNLQRYVWHRKK